MAEKDRNSYGNIFKAIGLFGGVKVIQIIVGIIKNKLVAMLLGPSGMGIFGLITSNTQLVKTLTDCGLHTSSIREISKSYTSGDEDKASRTISVFRKLVILTGLVGSIIVLIFAEQLSKISFGNYDYSLAFRLVSITLLLDQLCVGQTALMQGTFHYKWMARSSLLGSIIGLFVSIPLYYVWNTKAIVPVIILSSLTALILSWFYSNKVKIKKTTVTMREALIEGRGMLYLGVAIAASSIVRVGKAYGLRIFISHFGGIAEVGLFTSGMALSIQYVDVILSSMGSDYSPRLSAIVDDNAKFVETINKQIRLMCALLLPIMILFIVFTKELVIALYSREFIAIEGMVLWMMFSMFLRAISWCLSFPLVAIGNPKLFFWNEFSSELYSFIFSMIGYYYLSFLGLGLAFFMTQLCFSVQMLIVSRKYYHFKLTKQNKNAIIYNILLLTALFLVLVFFKGTILGYLLSGCVFILSLCYFYNQVNDMVNVKDFVRTKLLKKKYGNDS